MSGEPKCDESYTDWLDEFRDPPRGPQVCVLPAGHEGLHRDARGTRWMPLPNMKVSLGTRLLMDGYIGARRLLHKLGWRP